MFAIFYLRDYVFLLMTGPPGEDLLKLQKVKLDVFVRLKQGEEKLIANLIFLIFIREQHEDSIKQIKKICHIHFK